MSQFLISIGRFYVAVYVTILMLGECGWILNMLNILCSIFLSISVTCRRSKFLLGLASPSNSQDKTRCWTMTIMATLEHQKYGPELFLLWSPTGLPLEINRVWTVRLCLCLALKVCWSIGELSQRELAEPVCLFTLENHMPMLGGSLAWRLCLPWKWFNTVDFTFRPAVHRSCVQ